MHQQSTEQAEVLLFRTMLSSSYAELLQLTSLVNFGGWFWSALIGVPCLTGDLWWLAWACFVTVACTSTGVLKSSLCWNLGNPDNYESTNASSPGMQDTKVVIRWCALVVNDTLSRWTGLSTSRVITSLWWQGWSRSDPDNDASRSGSRRDDSSRPESGKMHVTSTQWTSGMVRPDSDQQVAVRWRGEGGWRYSGDLSRSDVNSTR